MPNWRALVRTIVQPLVLVLLTGLALCRPALGDTRVALVIANSAYRNSNPLLNPVNDGEDVAAALRNLGFKVTLARDTDKQGMDAAISGFAQSSSSADAALFFYAGHGMQFEGRNYLMPVDAALNDEGGFHREMVALDQVKAALSGSKAVKILILDACRDNPLGETFIRKMGSRGVSGTMTASAVRGLGTIEHVGGMVIAYSTQADSVAEDGRGRNSPFSSAFLHQMQQPGLELGVLFRRISAEVYASTGGHQEPEVSLSNIPDYYLNPPDAAAPSVKTVSLGSVDPKEKQVVGSPSPDSQLGATPPLDPRLLVPSIRNELRRIGCYTGADAGWGSPLMSKALDSFRKRSQSPLAIDAPSLGLMGGLAEIHSRICPAACLAGSVLRDGVCTVPVKPRQHPQIRPAQSPEVNAGYPEKRVAAQERALATAVASSPEKRCFGFKGKQYCE